MKLIKNPTIEPVSTEEAKHAARISDTDAFDELVPGYITSARQLAEQIAGRVFVEQTWQYELADWPAASDVIPIVGATGVAISYWSDAGAWVELSQLVEFADAGTMGTVVAPASGSSWPALGARTVAPRVRIDLTAGAPTANDVPECVKTFIKAVVAFMVDNPAAAADAQVQDVPLYRSLLDSVKVY